MKVLLTGASSFTGTWFAEALTAAGHRVVATMTGAPESYEGVRGRRVHQLRDLGVELVPGCRFGDETFLSVLTKSCDVLCHHAACVENYKSLDFDVGHAVAENTHSLRSVLAIGKDNGLRGIVLTGSVFEANEGVGNSPMRAFSPY